MTGRVGITDAGSTGRESALWMSTLAFAVCFAVWTIFSIIGVQIKQDLGLSDTQFGLLVGTPILTGSLIQDLPWPYLVHLVLGLTVFLVFPFSRLVHIWSAPVWYLGRRGYQVVRTRRDLKAAGRPT